MKTVILVNVGTPLSPEPEDVGFYLSEFLMDKNIITIPRPFRDILVKLLIVPKRKFSSSEKYKRVWTPEGSPLMVESKKLQAKLQKSLGHGWKVLLGMQFGEPRLKKIIQEALINHTEIYFCPLYPQFAQATTGGALQALGTLKVNVLKPFYNQDWFIKSQADLIRPHLTADRHLLLSYHGLPVAQLKSQNSFCHKNSDCCKQPQACEMNCYKAQCLKTSELLQKELGIQEISIGFQSRLGRAEWISPSTEEVVQDLLRKGVKNLVVACPSFVADCLETLEEIGMDLKEQFLHRGGESFTLVQCVNDDDQFVDGLSRHLKG